MDFMFPKVSFLQFIITLAVLILAIFGLSLYLGLFVWNFGKPLRKYLLAAITPRRGIIQEYALDNLNIHLARIDANDEFVDLERKGYFETTKLPRKWYQFWMPKEEKTFHGVKPLTSKSIIVINGVKTLLVWNVTPPMPARYVELLELLVKHGYENAENIRADIAYTEWVNELKSAGYENDIEMKQAFLDGVEVQTDADEQFLTYTPNKYITGNSYIPESTTTYKEFLELHEQIKHKNKISVTVNDVLNFNERFLDEHPKKSVIEKIMTEMIHRKTDDKYQKYAFFIVGMMVFGGLLILAYKTIYGGT